MKYRVLVFPCGSEIGLEINRALRFSLNIELYGASSTDDHGRFAYSNYIGGLPYIDNENFIEEFNKFIRQYHIDFIYPAHDSVVLLIAENQGRIAAKQIGSPPETARICRSKYSTYQIFKEIINTPHIYETLEEVNEYPVFLKPDVGQGAMGVHSAKNVTEASFYLEKDPSLLILEYLPGKEFTVDCFTDKFGELRFVGARERVRIMHGISVHTCPVNDNSEFYSIAKKINEKLIFRGAWFFQAKINRENHLCLLEISPRIAGSMALYRNLGVNFALLSVFDALDQNIAVCVNDFPIQMDRALSNKYKVGLNYQHVYVDLDDCIILEKKINILIIAFLYQCLNNNIKIHLLTRHEKDIFQTLSEYRIKDIFQSIDHIQDKHHPKSSYIKEFPAILIDDSFRERSEVHQTLQIPVFATDAVECLML